MFTNKLDELLLKFLPCKIGDTIYTIRNNVRYTPEKIYTYYLDEPVKCGGFVISNDSVYAGIYPAYDTWDGWMPILDHGHGYYTDIEEAKNKVKELNENERIRQENLWLESL